MTQNITTKRFISSILPMVHYAIDKGIEPNVILEGTFLNETHLLDANTPIDLHQELKIIRNLSEKCPHAELPWDLGRYYHAKVHGAIGSLVLKAPTFGDASRILPQYSILSHSFFRVHTEKTSQITRAYIVGNDLPEDMIPFLLERDLSALLTVFETLFPGKKNEIVRYISFAHAPRTHISRYRHMLFKNIDFNQPSTFIEIYNSALSLPMPDSDKQAFELLFQQVQAEYYLRGGNQMLLADKVLLFLQTEKGKIKLTEIADNLHMNEKSLRRQLLKEGTNFRKIKQDYIFHQATAFLKDPSVSIADIAEKLGYSETCAFTRAFQRQAGMSPSEYRKVYLKQTYL